MKIIILHGDHISQSRVRLQKFIESAAARHWDIVRCDCREKINLPELLSSATLFATGRLFVIENVNNLAESALKWLIDKGGKTEATAVFYQAGFLNEKILKALQKQAKIEEFKLPKIIFDFLQGFYPGNGRGELVLLHRIILKEPPEFVVALLGRQLRDILSVKLPDSKLPYPDWRVGKLKTQASRWDGAKLVKMISSLADADIKSKTSQSSLVSSLDLIIATQLE